ncbi:motility protein A [Kyrpidia spormannii]|uniref:Motility protein A n=1 Tax=Kyrpidia spormannii TaxID=2055160 RepID=A0A2K8N3C3_9BACL|nr:MULTISPECIES: flagellar motor protein [Kyrpidia]ATY83956.1 motility protein A [Kyrpidia spormannii]MCL6576203.1 flagellar motor protein [Kyrpidia sp.]HHY66792.1 flagellar motor protein [Alicyclobacillus sp.]
MDFASVFGMIAGIGALVTAFVLEGGDIYALFQGTAALIVFGGTFAATVVGLSRDQIRAIPALLKVAFFGKTKDPHRLIRDLVELAGTARKEGLLALEERIEEFEDPFMKQGIQLIVDGVDPELVRTMLETDVQFLENRHRQGVAIFESAGGYAPTMGILGTVMGLVHVLSNLSDVQSLGPLIATAFIATLYGVASANLIYFPIATKLKLRSEEEIMIRELIIEGVLSIQAGENPTLLGQKLKAFLPPKWREVEERKGDSREAA